MTQLVDDPKEKVRFVARFMPAEWESLNPTIERFGGPQLVGERLLRWFVNQHPLVQGMVLGQVPASEELIRIAVRDPDVAGKINPKGQSQSQNLQAKGAEAARRKGGDSGDQKKPKN